MAFKYMKDYDIERPNSDFPDYEDYFEEGDEFEDYYDPDEEELDD